MVNTKKATDLRTGQTMIERTLRDGTARAKFTEMLIAQGVAKETAESLTSRDFSCLPAAKNITTVKAHRTGIRKVIIMRQIF